MIFNPDQANEKNGESKFDIGAFQVGNCDFIVKNAIDYTAKSGNKSIKLTIEAADKIGVTKLMDCYLSQNAAFKIKEFCTTTDMIDKFEAGELKPEDCNGKSGECITHIEKGKPYKGKDGADCMGIDKIAIKYFVSKQSEPSEDIKEDDIPF